MFEWDERKRAANLAKHGIDFHRVAEMWHGPMVFMPGRAMGEEERLVAVGMIGDQIVAAIHVRRGGAVRIISARRARDYEKEAFLYHARNR